MPTYSAYESENRLARSLGWTPIKDNHRHRGSDADWCFFVKDGHFVWSAYPVWVRARKTNDWFVGHERYNTLKEALLGDQDNS